MRHTRWTLFGVITLIGLAALSMIASAAPVIIDFEDLSTTGPGQGGQVMVLNQYYNKGITFNNPVALDYSKGIAIPGFAHSGTKAIEQCYAKEFCATPIVMNFTAAQSRVKIWVGYSTNLVNQKTVVLSTFDSTGALVGQTTATFQPSTTPIPVQTPMEVISNSANIYSATVSFAPGANGLAYSDSLAVDDVEFETLAPTPTATPTPTPTATPTPTPTNGSISVSSTPSGASIYLDGSNTGQITPFILTDVPAGNHIVSVSLNGYTSSPSSQTVTVSSGSIVNGTFTLTPKAEIPAPPLDIILGALSVIGVILGLKYLYPKIRPPLQPLSDIGKQFPIIVETRGGIEGIGPNLQDYAIDVETRGGIERL